MKGKTVTAGLLAAACVLAASGCGASKTPEKNGYSLDASIENVEWVDYITGSDATTDTLEGWQVGGADLGFPCYDKTTDTMYVAFGDTFQIASSQSGLWRSNVVGITKDFTLSDGLSFDSFVGNGVIAQAIVDGYHMDGYEMTKIPTGGIEVNGTLYYFYFSKRTWANTEEVPFTKTMNYGGCVKSEDGQTWERLNDLSWLDPSVPACKEDIERLANQNVDMTDGDFGITMENHAGFSFTQVFPVDGKDGYVYILGEGGWRRNGIRLGRVAYADFEHFDRYEYYNGIDASGAPVWLKGKEGLDIVEANANSYIIDDECSEQSAMYDPYLGKWIVFYLKEAGGEKLYYRTADEIWGTYSDPVLVMDKTYPFPTDANNKHFYAGICHEKWTEENGKIIYLVVSQSKPVYNSSLVKVTFK